MSMSDYNISTFTSESRSYSFEATLFTDFCRAVDVLDVEDSTEIEQEEFG